MNTTSPATTDTTAPSTPPAELSPFPLAPEIKALREAAEVLDGHDRAMLAGMIREAEDRVAHTLSKTKFEEAAKLEEAAKIILAQFAPDRIPGVFSQLAKNVRLMAESTARHAAELAPENAPAPWPTDAEPTPGDLPTVVTMPLGSTLGGPSSAAATLPLGLGSRAWPPVTGFLRPKSESFTARRAGYDRGVQDSVDLLRLQARTTRKKGFTAAADLLEARLPRLAAKK